MVRVVEGAVVSVAGEAGGGVRGHVRLWSWELLLCCVCVRGNAGSFGVFQWFVAMGWRGCNGRVEVWFVGGEE